MAQLQCKLGLQMRHHLFRNLLLGILVLHGEYGHKKTYCSFIIPPKFTLLVRCSEDIKIALVGFCEHSWILLFVDQERAVHQFWRHLIK